MTADTNFGGQRVTLRRGRQLQPRIRKLHLAPRAGAEQQTRVFHGRDARDGRACLTAQSQEPFRSKGDPHV
jgi:hypothetical protein